MEEKDKIPGGWSSHHKGERDDSWWMDSQKDTSYTKHDPCLVLGVIEETEMIPVGWNSQKEASNTQQTNGPVEDML